MVYIFYILYILVNLIYIIVLFMLLYQGGSSWTANWLKFDNSYFVNLFNEQSDDELLKLGTTPITK